VSPTLIITGVVVLVTVAALVVWREPVLALGQRSSAFMRDVRAEMRKVSWPSWEDLRRSTIIITIIVIIIGIIIGLMDWLFSRILIDLFGRIFGR
jgi:preprotein translocase subunit SecE